MTDEQAKEIIEEIKKEITGERPMGDDWYRGYDRGLYKAIRIIKEVMNNET
jgi:hypothetical protein